MVIMTAKVPKRRILLVVLLLLAAAVAVMLFFLYGCVAGAAYSPRGRLVFIPLAQVSGSRTTSLFPLLSGRIGAVHRMVQCAGRYEKQARSLLNPGTTGSE